MKINIERDGPQEELLGYVDAGRIFKFAGHFYLKVALLDDDYNAIDLSDMSGAEIDERQTVEMVEATLTIYEKGP